MPVVTVSVPGRRHVGLTVVELLVVMAVLGILLGLLSAFFAQQSRIAAMTQARNEVEVGVRSVAELVVQDLQMAGSLAVYDRGTGLVRYRELAGACTAVIKSGCLAVWTDEDGAGGATTTYTAVYYATSLPQAPSQQCRSVTYAYAEGVLARSDVAACSGLPAPDFVVLATNLQAFDVRFVCETETGEATVDDPALCYSEGGGYPAFATITVVGRSDRRAEFEAAVTMSATTPNLRRPVDFVGAD